MRRRTGWRALFPALLVASCGGESGSPDESALAAAKQLKKPPPSPHASPRQQSAPQRSKGGVPPAWRGAATSPGYAARSPAATVHAAGASPLASPRTPLRRTYG